jgi:predicted PurR-regulated permease PerM
MPDPIMPAATPSHASARDGLPETTIAASEPLPVPPARVVHDIAPAALFKIIGAVLGVWLVIKVWPVLVLVVLSLMLVATFNPLVRRLQARFNRTWAITAVTLGIILLGAVLLVLTIPPLVRQGQNLIAHLPQ